MLLKVNCCISLLVVFKSKSKIKDDKILKSCGDIKRKIFPRSACKALQALACFEVNAHEKFQLTDEQIALLCASHNAEPEHLRVAGEMLAKINLTEASYECGGHYQSEKILLASIEANAGQVPPIRQIFNNCSGKHAGMLAACVALKIDPKGYTSKTHPIQRRIAKYRPRLFVFYSFI